MEKKKKGKESPEKNDKNKKAAPPKPVIMDTADTKVKIEEFMLRHNRPFST